MFSTAADTFSLLTTTAAGRALLDDADAAAQRATLGLTIGTHVQAYDADLTTWAGVTPGTGVATALAVAVGSAGAVVVNGGALGTPSSGTLTSATGLPISTGVSGLGTGIATALAVNTGSAGAPVLLNGALGTPSSGTLTNATGLPVGGISGLGTGVATFLATPSSANLVAAMTDEAGSGALYFTGGALGTPSSATLTNATGLPVSGITASTSAALGVGSIELGHASDTTLSRVSAGVVAIEGVEVTTNTATQTLTNKTLSSPTISGSVAPSGNWTWSTGTTVQTGNYLQGKGTVGGFQIDVTAATNLFNSLNTGFTAYQPLTIVANGLAYSPNAGGAQNIVTDTGTYTLSNKTLSSPTLSGTTTCGAINVSAASVAATINSTNNVYVLGISYASATGGYIGSTGAGNLRFTDSTITTILDVNTAKVVTTGTLEAKKTTSAASPDTSSNSITNVIFRVAGSNVGAAGYGIDMGVSNSDGTSWIQSRDHNNYATNSTLKLNPNGGGATLGGVAVPTISSTDTLTNKTLSSPTVSGTIAGGATWSGAQIFSNATTILGSTAAGAFGAKVYVTSGASTQTTLALYNPGVGLSHIGYDATDSRLRLYNCYADGILANGFGLEIATTGVLSVKTSGGTAVVPTISSTDTLSNKTLSSPTLSGTVAGTPTYSGAHTHAANDQFTYYSGGYQLAFDIKSTAPGYRFWETDGGADTKIWATVVAGNVKYDQLVNDAESASTTVCTTSRTGYASQIVNYTNTTLQVDSSTVATAANTLTLSNKTLSSPTLSGTVAGTPTYSGQQAYSATPRYNNVDILMYDGSNNAKWSFGRGSGGTGDAFAFYSYGTTSVQMYIDGGVTGGVVVGAPTGGAKGTGTLNCTGAYDDNVLLTDLVLDYAVTGSFDTVKYANHPLRDQVAPWWFNPDQYAEFWKTERRLPGMLTWDDPADKPSTGESITRLTAVVEMQAALIENLNQRLKELEK